MVMPLQPGDPIAMGPYQLLGRLGAGGMGQVYLGGSPGGRHVAVKVIRSELAALPEFRIRFGQEVGAARTVSGLFTAPVVDADLDAPMPWLATAYVPGPSLSEAIERHGPLPVRSVLALAAGLAEGINAIHRAGIVHRDLKPSNVLLSSDGPRVIDFGISRAMESASLTATGMVMGSPGFMSPEQAIGAESGPPSDVFSLGAVLVFAATGSGPFGGGPSEALLFRVVNQQPEMPALSAELRPLIMRCLAKDPRLRPTPGQLLAELSMAPVSGWLPGPLAQELPAYTQPDPILAPPSAPAQARTMRLGPAGAVADHDGWRTPGAMSPVTHGTRPRRAIGLLPAVALVIAVIAGGAAAALLTRGNGGTRGAAGASTATVGTVLPSSPPSSSDTGSASANAGSATAISSTASPTASHSATVQPSQSSSPATDFYWTAAVMSARIKANADAMRGRLLSAGYDGEVWFSTAGNSVLPGYWVVTSGQFPDRADASARAAALQAAGFTGAYARCVGPRQACG
jgi:eukaryotic-like serine/threonine-protein kinase